MKNLLFFIIILSGINAQAQNIIRLDLKKTITMANDSSLSAFRYQNMYLSGYWEYRSYKLPDAMILNKILMCIANSKCIVPVPD